MYIDLIILMVLMLVVVIFFKRFSSFVFFIAIVDIFLRILTFIKNNIGLYDIKKSNKELIISIISKYIFIYITIIKIQNKKRLLCRLK